MDRFYYFSRSAERPPGKGTNEYVVDPRKYQELAAIPHWRRQLSNFWVAPFQIGERWWNSVEHFYQSQKIGLVDPLQGDLFSLNSGSALSKAHGSEAQSKRKMVKLTPQLLQYWEQIKSSVIKTALRAKFSQNPELAQTLLSTHDAQLWHGAPRIPAERQWGLEEVRTELRNSILTPLTFQQAMNVIGQGGLVTVEIIPRIDGNSLVKLYNNLDEFFLVKGMHDPSTGKLYEAI